MDDNTIDNETAEVESVAQGVSAADGVGERFGFNNLVGWGLSLGLHCLLVVILMVVTWSGRPGDGGYGQGKEVGIVVEETGLNVDDGQADLAMENGLGGQLGTASIVGDVVESTKTMDLQGSEHLASTGLDALIGLESVTVGEDGAMTDKWNSVVSGGGGSSGGTTSFFGLTAKGSKFVYVVDYSGSMNGAKFLAAKAELLRSIMSLKNNMKFYIIFYNQSFISMPAETLVAATKENKNRYFNWVESISAGGGTQPTEGMLKALSLKPDSIWMLSDGQFGPQVCDAIRQGNVGGKVQIHTIAFYDNTGEVQLKRIAKDNRGAYRFVGGRGVRPRRFRGR